MVVSNLTLTLKQNRQGLFASETHNSLLLYRKHEFQFTNVIAAIITPHHQNLFKENHNTNPQSQTPNSLQQDENHRACGFYHPYRAQTPNSLQKEENYRRV